MGEGRSGEEEIEKDEKGSPLRPTAEVSRSGQASTGSGRTDWDEGESPVRLAEEDGRPGRASTGSGRAAEGDACPFCGAAGGEGRVRIGPNKHREVQVRRLGSRLLFDRERKESFLQWFALTANVSFAAEQAGVCRQTVSKHRLSDAAFAERYLEALSLAVPDLQARLIAYLQGRPKLNVAGELEPPDDEGFGPATGAPDLARAEQDGCDGQGDGTFEAGAEPEGGDRRGGGGGAGEKAGGLPGAGENGEGKFPPPPRWGRPGGGGLVARH